MLIYTRPAGDGIFDVLGRLFATAEATNVSRGTIVPEKVANLSNQFKKDPAATNEMNAAFSDLPQGQTSWQAQGDAFLAGLSNEASAYLRAVVLRDDVQPADTILNALQYLIRNMIADGAYVTSPALGLTLTPAAGNSGGDLAILFTHHRGDGLPNFNLFAEDVAVTISAVATDSVSIRFLTPSSVGPLSHAWPAGSGVNRQVNAISAGTTLVSNGTLESTGFPNVPNDFKLLDGMPGTDYLMTTFEVQRIVVTGTPAAGGFYLLFNHPNGTKYISAPLPFDVTGAGIQGALRAMPGLNLVTVTSTGTAPNYTHEVTFTGLAGDVNLLSVENQTDAGGFVITSVTPGDPHGFRGKSLRVVGSSAAHRRIYHVLPNLTPNSVYFAFLRHKKTATPVTGSVRLAIVQGIGGPVTVDQAGTANAKTFNLTNAEVPIAYGAGWLSFRINPTEPQPLYLEIDAQNLAAGCSYCLDDVGVFLGQELYPGGPFVAVVRGADGPLITDAWTLAAANNYAGEFQSWFDRMFDMRGKTLLLPTSGSALIPDSLIS
jgi:hypothetical protein